MEQHYRRLVWAVLAVTVLVVAGVGWGSLRGGPRSTVIAAAPRALDLPVGAVDAGAATTEADGGAASSETPAIPAVEGVVAPAGAPAASPAAGGAAALLRVHVVGSVRRAGVYELPPGARVIDAVEKAGGARADADLETINLADFARDGEQIHVPSRRVTRAAAHPAAAAPVDRRVSATAPPAPRAAPAPTRGMGRYPAVAPPAPRPEAPAGASGGMVNVNTAGLEELETLPGVGPVTAQAILDYRREHGPFQRPEDLLNVRGIGEKKLAQMLPRVTVR